MGRLGEILYELSRESGLHSTYVTFGIRIGTSELAVADCF
jgi:hypothetical protein